MTYRMRRRGWLLGLTLAIALVATACGGDDDAGSGTGGGTASRASIVIDGSSTVAPVTEAIAEEFHKEQSGVKVTVGTSGTGGGFTKFCAGETDVQDASRPIDDEEKAACEAKGIKYQEFRIGLDGLAVVILGPEPVPRHPELRAAGQDLRGGRGQDLEPGRPQVPQRGDRHLRSGRRVRHLRLLQRAGPG